MSTLQNEMLLESLFEEALEEVTNNNPLGFNDEELQFSAELLAQQRFEDLAQWKKDYVLNLHKVSMTTYITLCVLKMR